jgi:hypothetical protein
VATPPRRPGSVRRTTTHDCTRPEGLDGPVVVTAVGRDLRTETDGSATVIDASQIDVRSSFGDGLIAAIVADPPSPGLDALVGRSARRGFRRAITEALGPDERPAATVRFQLLDDLPVALMLSGRVLRLAGISLPRPEGPRRLPIDICAGWAEGGTLLAGYGELGPPLHEGPVAPALGCAGDPLAWHDLDVLPARATRRCRRFDIWPDDGFVHVETFFRDSVTDAFAVETVVHEYTVRVCVDPPTDRIVSSRAEPGPLPYPECPAAVASAATLSGAALSTLRTDIPSRLVGPSTCTHLNDVLRSLEGITALLLKPALNHPD